MIKGRKSSELITANFTNSDHTSRITNLRNIETFEDLDVWKTCTELRRDVSDLVRTFPPEEKFRLMDQMVRASRSVTANIAEAFGRFHYQESVQFCRQARGSLYELIDHLHVAVDQNYLPKEAFVKCREDVLRGIKILNGFIRYLSKERKKS